LRYSPNILIKYLFYKLLSFILYLIIYAENVEFHGELKIQKARIRLSSTKLDALSSVCDQIESVCQNQGIKKYGPIPLPSKHLKVPVMKNVSGQGTNQWAKFEMRIHKRLIDIVANERSMHLIMKIQIPETVLVEIELQ
jgi:small subunit ribosomal protein S10